MNEEYRFSDMEFLEEEFSVSEQSEAKLEIGENHLVFVNGNYSEKLSTATFKVNEGNMKGDDVITELNSSHKGKIVEINLDKDMKITHINTNKKNIGIPRIKVNVKGKVNLFEEFIDVNDDKYLSVPVMEIKVDEGDELTHVRIQKQNKNSFHLGKINCEVKGRYNSFVLSNGCLKSRNEIVVSIEKGEAYLYGLYNLDGDMENANYSTIHHKKEDTESYQLYNGILNGNSHGIFRGRIIVDEDAQRINSYQMNKNLMLGENASVNSLPQLEISADDVKCSHGSTIGQLDEEELFYLTSRGISKKRAKEMICSGFSFEPILKLNEKARKFVMEYL